MTRDLSAELRQQQEREELEALRTLRDAVLNARTAISKSNRYQSLTHDEGLLVAVTFNAEGHGPFTTLSTGAFWDIANHAERAKSLEVA